MDNNSLTEIRNEVMQYYLDPQNTAVREYYDADNIWKTLKIERDENRHSAFLAWFFGLDYESVNAPLYRLLALLVSKGNSNDNKREYLVNAIAYQTLRIKKATVETEKVISKFTKIQYNDRIDIFITCDVEGCSNFNKIEIIVENKVESTEGGQKAGEQVPQPSAFDNEYWNSRSQTERYCYACSSCREDDFDVDNTLQIFVYLTPKKEGPSCNEFIKISYQDLVDYIFDPFVKSKGINDYTKNTVTEYMRILCNPNNKYNSILATMEEEKELLKNFYDRNIDLFLKSLQVLHDTAETEEQAKEYDETASQVKVSKTTRKRRSYSINNSGKFTIYDTIAEFVKKRLADGEELDKIEEFIREKTEERDRVHLSRSQDEVYNPKGKEPYDAVDNKGKKFYLTKEWGGATQDDYIKAGKQGVKDNNFVLLYKAINDNYSDFHIEELDY